MIIPKNNPNDASLHSTLLTECSSKCEFSLASRNRNNDPRLVHPGVLHERSPCTSKVLCRSALGVMLEKMVTYYGGPVWVKWKWEALTVGTNHF